MGIFKGTGLGIKVGRSLDTALPITQPSPSLTLAVRVFEFWGGDEDVDEAMAPCFRERDWR